MNRIKSDVQNDIEIEYLPQKSIDDISNGLNILIKHNFYSSDSNHGKELLSNILYLLSSQDAISTIMVVDSGVKLFTDPDFKDDLYTIVDKSEIIYVCSESVEEFQIEIPDNNKVIISDSQLFFEQLLIHKPDFIIE